MLKSIVLIAVFAVAATRKFHETLCTPANKQRSIDILRRGQGGLQANQFFPCAILTLTFNPTSSGSLIARDLVIQLSLSMRRNQPASVAHAKKKKTDSTIPKKGGHLRMHNTLRRINIQKTSAPQCGTRHAISAGWGPTTKRCATATTTVSFVEFSRRHGEVCQREREGPCGRLESESAERKKL